MALAASARAAPTHCSRWGFGADGAVAEGAIPSPSRTPISGARSTGARDSFARRQHRAIMRRLSVHRWVSNAFLYSIRDSTASIVVGRMAWQPVDHRQRENPPSSALAALASIAFANGSAESSRCGRADAFLGRRPLSISLRRSARETDRAGVWRLPSLSPVAPASSRVWLSRTSRRRGWGGHARLADSD